jgi:AcrR family transcriptional regulator
MEEASTRPPHRSTYRHGDLRRALVDAGTELARDGGPDAVVLREATRRVGVAPNAAYRHFADRQALVDAVCAVAQLRLVISMERGLADLPARRDAAANARAQLRALGVAYLGFAQREPGLFRTAFSVPGGMEYALHPILAGNTGRTAFQLLGRVLDDLVDTGVLTAARRSGAEILAWSAVHGLAVLLIDGPLRGLGPATTAEIERRLIEMVEHGL